jgi:hypothetical protein
MQKDMKEKMMIYQAKNGAIELRGDAEHKTVWATQSQIAEIFDVNSQAITKHIRNVYSEGELSKKSTCSKMEQVRTEGKRTVKRSLETYNLDVIIAVGYRINSIVGTKFRQWATKLIQEYIAQGYTIDKTRVALHCAEFQKAVEDVKALLPTGKQLLSIHTLIKEEKFAMSA